MKTPARAIRMCPSFEASLAPHLRMRGGVSSYAHRLILRRPKAVSKEEALSGAPFPLTLRGVAALCTSG